MEMNNKEGKMVTLNILKAKQVLGDKLVVVIKDKKTGEEVELHQNPEFAIAVEEMRSREDE